MKRVAEKQLIKDDGDDGDDGEEEGQGFRRADETVLATRKIRALPKRSQSSTSTSTSASMASSTSSGMLWSTPTATAPAEEAAPVSKFAGFTGFGVPSTSSAPKSGFSFSSQPPSSTTTTGASSAAKTFASFLGGASNGSDTKSAPASSEEDKAAIEYYSSLRGLNVSFLKAINRYVEEDPFVDISDVLERYKNLRATVQKDFDSKKSSSTPKMDVAPDATPKMFTMPTPPASFAHFGSGSSTATTTPSEKKSAPPAGGLIFKPSVPIPSSSSSPFSFTPSQPKSSESSLTGPASFTFGAPASTSATTALAPTSSGFTLGAPAKDSNSSSGSSSFLFGAPPPKATNGSSSSLPFSFTPPSSATTTTAPKSIFGGGAPKGEEKTTSTPSNPFGVPSSSTGSAFGSFGSFGAKPASASSTSGSAGGSAVGFSFGSSTPITGSSSTLGSGFSSSGTGGGGFSFGASSSAIASSDKKDEEGEGSSAGGGEGSTGAGTSSNPAMLGVNPHDAEGEGEEDEETTHAVKSKVYRMKKVDEKGGPGWVEIGYGILRLKKNKNTDARRMLLRNSTTGKINVNFVLYSGLKPSQAKKAVTFVGHDNGVAQTYSVRVGSEEQAKELKEALEREIASVKAKS